MWVRKTLKDRVGNNLRLVSEEIRETTDHKQGLALGKNVDYFPHRDIKDRKKFYQYLLEANFIIAFKSHKIFHMGTTAANLGDRNSRQETELPDGFISLVNYKMKYAHGAGS